MNFFRSLFFFTLVVVIGWTGYFYYQHHRVPTLDEAQQALSQIPTLFSQKVATNSVTLPKIDQGNQQSLTQAINEGKTRVDEALNDAIIVASDSDKPAAQKALDYGRYLYCKQVVEQYDRSSK
ncbi:hypothetical protein KA012_00555 [Candidatus Woesebacteria bacterium]|nr:hypothetical protein [Candidatus Woesebacteria bacterium]